MPEISIRLPPWFACQRDAEEGWDLLLAPADGTGEAESLYSGSYMLTPYSWLPDGKRLALHCSNMNIYVLTLDGPRELEPVLTTDFS